MRLWMFLLIAAAWAALGGADGARGQNTVSVNIGGKSWTFSLNPSVAKLSCDKTALSPGDSSTCTISLDLPAPAGGWTITPYTADSPLVLSPATLTVNAGATTATFTVSRPASSGAPVAPVVPK